MSVLSNIRALGGLVTAGLGRPVRIMRWENVGTGWNPATGLPLVEPDGQFGTLAVMPSTDAAMQGVIAETVSRTAVIETGAATSGGWFQPRKNDLLELLDGPELHPAGSTTLRMVFSIETVNAIAGGGSLRLGMSAPHAVAGALGGGTASD